MRSLLLFLVFSIGSLSAIAIAPTDSLRALIQTKTNADRIVPLTELGRLYKASRPDSALIFLHEAADLAVRHHSPDAEGKARLYIGQTFLNTGEYDSAMVALQQGITAYERARNVAGVGKCWNSIGTVHYYRNEFAAAAEAYTQALEHFSDPFYIATSYNNIALNKKMAGDGPGFVKNQLLALKKFEEIGRNDRVLVCLGNLAVYHMERDDLEKALEYNQMAYESLATEGAEEYEVFLGVQKGEIMARMGKEEEALMVLRETRALAAEGGFSREEASAWGEIGIIYSGKGEYKMARPRLENALAIYRDLEDLRGQARVLGEIGWVQLQTDAADSSIHTLQKSLKLALELGEPTTLISLYERLGGAYEQIGDYKNATHYREQQARLQKEVLSPKALRPVLEMEAEYQEAREAEALQQLQTEQDRVASSGDSIFSSSLFWAIAGLIGTGILGFFFLRSNQLQGLIDRKQAVEAQGRIKELRALLAEKDERIARLRQDATEGKSEGAPQLPPEFDTLTGREIEVFLCLGVGLSDKEIAEELSVSLSTVRTHVRNIYSKINLNSRAQAVHLAHEYRLIRKD